MWSKSVIKKVRNCFESIGTIGFQLDYHMKSQNFHEKCSLDLSKLSTFWTVSRSGKQILTSAFRVLIQRKLQNS